MLCAAIDAAAADDDDDDANSNNNKADMSRLTVGI